MKNIIFVISLLFAFVPLRAQKQFLASEDEPTHNYFDVFYEDSISQTYLFVRSWWDTNTNTLGKKYIKTDYDGAIVYNKSESYTLNDYVQYREVYKLSPNEYIFVGEKRVESPNFIRLINIRKTDSNFNIIWEKTYDTPDTLTGFERMFCNRGLNGNYILSGNVRNRLSLTPMELNMYLFELNANFDSIQYKVIVDTSPLSNRFRTFSIAYPRHDSSLYVAANYTVPAAECIKIFDTNLNITRVTGYPYSYPMMTTGYLMGYPYLYFDSLNQNMYMSILLGKNPNQRHYIFKYTNDLRYIKYVTMPGSKDSVEDYAHLHARLGPIAQTKDHSLYSLEVSHFVPGLLFNSYVLVNKLDTSLQIVWTREFGGDANYYPIKIIPTNDNGVMIVCFKEYYQSPNPVKQELYLFKLDAYGTLLSIQNLDSEKSESAILYPNPAEDILHITLTHSLPNALLTLYDLHGRSILQHTLSSGHNMLHLPTLASGSYLYHIQDTKSFRTIQSGQIRIR